MPSTVKLTIWVPGRWLDRLIELGSQNGTNPTGYVRRLVAEEVGEEDESGPTAPVRPLPTRRPS